MAKDNDIGDALTEIFGYMQRLKKSGIVEQVIDDASATRSGDAPAAKSTGVGELFILDENRSQTDEHSEHEGDPEK
jgi:uncharacterized SAM-binding protein YcdF (DUF218 family)